MSLSSSDVEWGMIHDLALLYLTLTHGADNEIDASEQQKMEEKLVTWQPSFASADVQKAINTAMLTYMGQHRRPMIDTAMVSLKASMDKETRIAVLNDLADLATADGLLLPSEISFIQQLAHYWEVDKDIQD